MAFSFKQLDNDLCLPITNLLLIFTTRSRCWRNSTEAKAFQFKLLPLLRLGMKPFVMMTQVIYGKVIFNAFIAYELWVYNFLLLKALAAYEVGIHSLNCSGNCGSGYEGKIHLLYVFHTFPERMVIGEHVMYSNLWGTLRDQSARLCSIGLFKGDVQVLSFILRAIASC